METLYQILAIVGAGFISWILYQTIKNQPQQFTQAKISKSLFKMGMLALMLIAFVSLLVLLLRSG